MYHPVVVDPKKKRPQTASQQQLFYHGGSQVPIALYKNIPSPKPNDKSSSIKINHIDGKGLYMKR